MGKPGHVVLCLALGVISTAQAWIDPRTLPPEPSRPSARVEEQGSSSISTLSDIKRIAIQIRGTNSREWRRYGLSDTELREAITKRLQAAGFKVAGPAASLSDPDTVVLDVDVHVNDQTIGHSFLVFVRLKDKLPLPQNPEGYITRTVWSDWKVGGFEAYNYRKLRTVILQLIDGFVGNYQLAP